MDVYGWDQEKYLYGKRLFIYRNESIPNKDFLGYNILLRGYSSVGRARA